MGNLSGALLISEFMANNTRTVADEEGNFSDWVEIHNPGSDPVDLDRWSLTDDPSNLSKWRFPATNLAPQGFLVVFASGRDRRSPGLPLHTSFRLADAGEYLALVEPDGRTVASAYAPAFPSQKPDVSYGLAARGTNHSLVATGAVARAWVPRDPSLGVTWTDPAFDDLPWSTGTTGVGYERSSGYEGSIGLDLLDASLPPALRIDQDGDGVNENTSVYVRIPFVLPVGPRFNTLRLRMRHDDGFVAYLNGQRVAQDNEPAALEWNSRAASDYGDATDVMIAITYGPGNKIALYRNGQLYADAARASQGSLQTYRAKVATVLIGKRHEDLPDGGTASGADGFLAGSVNEARIYGRTLSADDISVLFKSGPLRGLEPPRPEESTNLLHLWSFNDGTGRDAVGSAHGTLLNGAAIDQGRLVLDGVNDYLRSSTIDTNISVRTLVVWVSLANLSQQAGSALSLVTPTGTDVFDGIVYAERVPNQWMNGSSFFDRSVADNGGAPESVVEGVNAGFVAYDLSSQASLLRPGTNLLAIHALNFAPDDSDLLVLPELVGGAFTIDSGEPGYFDRPSPGAMNSGVFQRVVATLSFNRAHGWVTEAFPLEITSDVSDVVIRYTLDGSAPSADTGEGYTGPISITHNSVVRAAAFRTGQASTEPVTQTYLFLPDVLRQTNSAPAGAHWDTEMDPEIVANQNQTWTVAQGLVDLPVLSIAMNPEDLFGVNGIYPNASSRGEEWERAASVELFYPDESLRRREDGGFSINAGIQINGNFSRLTHQPKHSFRLVFKEAWGAASLNYPVFEDSPVTEFDTLVVGCGHNQGWSTGIENSQFLRNRFAWDLEGAEPGRAFVHSRSVHLFLNGLYWGLYDLGERPDDSFSAANFGGAKESYDVFKGLRAGGSTEAQIIGGTRDAWSELFAAANGNLSQASNYATIERLVDLDQFIDYSIGILYTADRDGPTGWLNGPPNSLEPKNFYATRRRTPEGRFRFWRWDSEFTLESESEDVSERDGFENPGHLHFRLRTHPEYRMRLADHVQRLFFNDGPFSTTRLLQRYASLAGEVERAVVAESARWGDAKREPPFKRDVEWVTERDRILRTYLPRRQNIFLAQLRADKLFPNLGAPILSIDGVPQVGGEVGPGAVLSMTISNLPVYFTLDGTDPRAVGGAVSASARVFTSPLEVADAWVVKARAFTNEQWSALTEATFHRPLDWSKLVVSEIMYHPAAPTPDAGDGPEFLELKNEGTDTLALDGLQWVAGIQFAFPRGTLLRPGKFVVLVKDPASFQTRYPAVRFDGVYLGSLRDKGESLRLVDRRQRTVLELAYDNQAPWPAAADGLGFSLVPNRASATSDGSTAATWRASARPGGSPGEEDPASAIPTIRINELLSNPGPGQRDTVELFNPTSASVDVGGWFLTDDRSRPRKYRIPPNTVLAPGGFWVVDERAFNASGTTNDFAFSSRGEDVFLFSADATGNFTGYSDGFSFGAASPGVSWGRWRVPGTGEDVFIAQSQFTPGRTNSGPLIGPVVISEILADPRDGAVAFVELFNIGEVEVPLFDTAHPMNTWRLNGLGFSFPPNIRLAAWQRLLVVAGDPEQFRAQHGIPSSVPLFGPYAGRLQPRGERLELQRPGVTDTNGVSYVTVDSVDYRASDPWPKGAFGTGASLQRVEPTGLANDPANWVAAIVTPGAGLPTGQAPTFSREPVSVVALAGSSVDLFADVNSPASARFQWFLDNQPLAGATASRLRLTEVESGQVGNYRVVAFNAHGSVVSSNAELTLSAGPMLLTHPSNRTVTSGGNATFSAVAVGNGALRFQWQFNGVELTNQTNATLTLTRVQPAQEGDYRLLVFDESGSAASRRARLFVSVRPTLLTPLEDVWALEGQTVNLVAVTAGSQPMTHFWRRNGVLFSVLTHNASVGSLILSNVSLASAGRFSVTLSNLAGVASVSLPATLTVLADADRDGMSDVWEVAYGFPTNSVGNASLDPDGDGLSNQQEFLAGTDPTRRESRLRLDGRWLGSELELSFLAVSNRPYWLQYRDVTGEATWNVLTNLASRPTNRVARVIDPALAPGRFYRLLIP